MYRHVMASSGASYVDSRGAGTMHLLTGTALLAPPLLAYALREEWGVFVVFAPGVADTDRQLVADSVVEEMTRTGRDRAWRTSAE